MTWLDVRWLALLIVVAGIGWVYRRTQRAQLLETWEEAAARRRKAFATPDSVLEGLRRLTADTTTKRTQG